jgi:hypothetical protein
MKIDSHRADARPEPATTSPSDTSVSHELIGPRARTRRIVQGYRK